MGKARLLVALCGVVAGCGDDGGGTASASDPPPRQDGDFTVYERDLAGTDIGDNLLISFDIAEQGFVSDLRVTLEMEHPRVAELLVFLTHTDTGASITLLRLPASTNPLGGPGDSRILTFGDSSPRDAQNDVVSNPEAPDAQAFPDIEYRPFEPLALMRGDTLEGSWRLQVLDPFPGADGSVSAAALSFLVSDEALPPEVQIATPRGVPDAIAGVSQDQSFRYRAPVGSTPTLGSVSGATATFIPGPSALIRSGIVTYNTPSEGTVDLSFDIEAGGATGTLDLQVESSPARRNNIELTGHLSLAELGYPGSFGLDLWGWTDPDNGTDYVIVGSNLGVSVVDISTPSAPVVVGTLDTFLPNEFGGIASRDIKVYADHAFVVSEVRGHGLQIFDLTELRELDGSEPVALQQTAHFDGFGNAHNIAMDESSGIAYVVGATQGADEGFEDTCAGGIYVLDVSTPALPTFQGCFSGASPANPIPDTAYPTDVYTHDAHCVIYAGPDPDWAGQRLCFSADSVRDGATSPDFDNFLAVADLSDPAAPMQISRFEYTDSGFSHQPWLTEDQRYLFLNDEFDERTFESRTRTIVFDLEDVDAPLELGVFENPSRAIGHNFYVQGETLYMANYSSGLRVVDLNRSEGVLTVGDMEEIAFFDTHPDDDDDNEGLGSALIAGAFTAYPYFSSGIIPISDFDRGLFLVRLTRE